MKRIFTLLLTLVILGVTFKAIHEVQTDKNRLRLKEIKIQNIHQELNKLEGDYNQLNKNNKSKEDEIRKLKEREAELEKQLQAKRLLKAQEAKAHAERQELASKAQTPATEPVSVSDGKCNTGNKYKDFIYYKESTCNPSAVNSIGCRGIGQACPGSKLPCGNDFECQDKWFTNYAMQRYGSWEAAYNFWIRNNWW